MTYSNTIISKIWSNWTQMSESAASCDSNRRRVGCIRDIIIMRHISHASWLKILKYLWELACFSFRYFFFRSNTIYVRFAYILLAHYFFVEVLLFNVIISLYFSCIKKLTSRHQDVGSQPYNSMSTMYITADRLFILWFFFFFSSLMLVVDK